MLSFNTAAWSWVVMLSLVSARSSTQSHITSSTSSSASATHTVKVGPRENPHQYVPHNVSANVGDVILFEFYPTNHSVVKADYMAPCIPAKGEIFYSGQFNDFQQENGQIVGEPPTWSLVVNDTEPAFFYCTAIDSCTSNGMVGAINPNKSMTWKKQYKKAKHYPYMLVPGEPMPAEGDNTDTTPSSTPTASSSSTATPDNDSSDTGLGGGAIAGIVVGVVAFVAILVALFFVLGRNRVYQKWMSSEDGRNERTARWALFNSTDPFSRRSEMEASSQPPGDQPMAMYPSSPDQTRRTFSASPQANSGHWSWKFQQQAPYQQPTPPAPTELEATSVPGSSPTMR